MGRGKRLAVERHVAGYDFIPLGDGDGRERLLPAIDAEPAGVVKRKPAEWAADQGILILDPDGWRADDADFNAPVSFEEYEKRVQSCTIRPLPEAS